MQGDCTCPAFEDAGFCKHLVALGLTIIEPEPASTTTPALKGGRKRGEPVVSVDDVREHLSSLSRDRLVQMLVTQAMEHPPSMRRLRLDVLHGSAVGASSPKKVLETLRDAIDQATEVDDYDGEWPNEHEVASALEELVKQVAGLLQGGAIEGTVELIEYFIAAVEGIIGQFHEGFYLGDTLAQLQKMHLQACRAAKPDPEALAERLFHWELSSGWDVFSGSLQTYASVLGKRGVDSYRKLAEKEWAKVPERKPASLAYSFSSREAVDYPHRYRITGIMESIAKHGGDVDAIAAIRAKDLSSGYQYLGIAELYASHRQSEKALTWAEAGLKAFADRPDGRLREFVANEYHRLRRHDEAMKLIWAEFSEGATLDRFKLLKAHADRISRWAEWREKAVARLRVSREKASASKSSSSYGWHRRDDSSTLVEIFLWEKDIDAAWDEATTGGASEALWHRLAGLREKSRPEDAIPVYRRLIDSTLSRANNDAYREAVELITKVDKLMDRVKQGDRFAVYLQEIRSAHKPKRNFVKLLDTRF